MNLSSYANSLETDYKIRYISKIKGLGIDPYLISNTKKNELPLNVKMCDIFDFFMSKQCSYTGNPTGNSSSFRRAQEAFENGWVQDIAGKEFPAGTFVVLGQVSSQLQNK